MGNLSNLNFNAEDPVHEQRDFSPLPEGRYPAIIEASEIKETKARTGQYMELTFQIIGEYFAGRKCWARLNLWNPSDQAVEIAKKEFASICKAVGVMAPVDSSELHNIPLEIKVVQREYQGETQNEIKAYYAIGGANTAPKKITTPRNMKPADTEEQPDFGLDTEPEQAKPKPTSKRRMPWDK